jgi:hypothetical protein
MTEGGQHLALSVSGGKEGARMACPYLKEVVMLYCQAYPVKKLVPLDRIASAEPCLGHDYEACPLFKDVLTRIRAHSHPGSTVEAAPRQEVFR